MKPIDNRNSTDTVKVGSWIINSVSGKLSDGKGGEVYLEPRLAKLFCLLGKNVNTLVTRDALVEEVWNETIVNEESLTKAISDLRKVLKVNFDNPPQIITLPRRGYKMTISTIPFKRPAWKIALIYAAYSVITFTLLILVIRGLNY
ncbi:MAG: winged helix-turn-helix domain-containing protein [Calditrichia bacterium]